MGIHRTAIILAVSHSIDYKSHNNNHTLTTLTSNGVGVGSPDYYYSNYYNGTYKGKGFKSDFGEFHGNVNILLGGAMLIVIATIVFLICYCCHRKTKMRSSLYMQHRWFDNDFNMEVYSVEQYFDLTTLHGSDDSIGIRNINERPPSYECIMSLNEAASKSRKLQYLNKVEGLNTLMSADTARATATDVNANNAQLQTQADISDYLNNNEAMITNDDESAATISDDSNGNISIVASELDMIKAKGIIKLDLSKMMDQTGLPTYESALKLKSSNYI